MGKVVEFLQFYPEHSTQFRYYQANLHKYTTNIYRFYVNIFITHNMQLNEVDHTYRISLKQIHHHYREVLVPQMKFVTLQTVIEYVNALPEAILMGVIR
jgi:hypothetical protein